VFLADVDLVVLAEVDLVNRAEVDLVVYPPEHSGLLLSRCHLLDAIHSVALGLLAYSKRIHSSNFLPFGDTYPDVYN